MNTLNMKKAIGSSMLALLFIVSTPTQAAQTKDSNPNKDTVVVDVSDSQVLIQTENISSSLKQIQTDIMEISSKMSEVSSKMASTTDAEERAALDAEMKALNGELKALEAEIAAINSSLDQDIQISVVESPSLFYSGDDGDNDDWNDWDDEGDDESDDWDDWDWESDNGSGTVGTGDFFIGMNNYIKPDGKFPTDPADPYALKTFGSWHWGFNGGYKTRIGRSGPLHIKYALEFEWRNYNLAGNTMISKGDSGMVQFTKPTDGTTYRKNRFNTLQFNIPVMLQLDFSDNRTLENGFNIGVGGYAGVCFWGYSKAVYTDQNGDRAKDYVRGDMYTNNVRYGVMAQVGFGWVNFYARYDLNTIFREGQGPELNGLMFGLVF